MMKKNNINCLFLDIGNVLFYFDPAIALKKISCITGREISLIVSQMEKPTDDFERGLINSDEYYKIFVSLYGNIIGFKEFSSIYNNIFTPNYSLLNRLPVLREKYDLVIVSNTNEMHLEYLNDSYKDYFDCFLHLVCSHEIGYKKPETGFFMTALKLSGKDVSEVLYFDDIRENVYMAASLGIKAVLYREYPDFENQVVLLEKY